MAFGFSTQLFIPLPSSQCYSPKSSFLIDSRACNSTVHLSPGTARIVQDLRKFSKFHPFAEKNHGITNRWIDRFPLTDKTFETNKEKMITLACFRDGNGAYERDTRELVEILRECARKGSLLEGKGIHGFLLKTSLGDDAVILFNHLAHMYANCKSFMDAHKVFEQISQRNAFSWTVVIVGSTQNGLPLDGFKFFCEMLNSGIQPDKFSHSAAIQSCIGLESVGHGRMVHAQVCKSSYSGHVFVCTALLNMYAKFSMIEDAVRIFERMDEYNQVSWNALISGYTQNNLHQEAFDLFLLMKRKGFQPNLYTFASVLKACGMMGDLDKGKEIHSYVIESDLESNVIVGTALIDMYAKCGSLSAGKPLFENIVFNCNENMPWNAMISGYSQSGSCDQALELFYQMHCRNIKPDIFTFCSILNSSAALKSSQRSRELHGLVIKHGDYSQVLTVNNALVDTYAKCGFLDEARKVFQRMEIRDVVSWTTMVTACAQNLQGDEALDTFLQMRLENLCPNQFTFASVLVGCASVSVVEYGEQIHGHVCKSGFENNVCVESALIDMYAKCGNIVNAQKVFERIDNPDIVSWTAIILGHALHGSTNNALKLFSQMEQAGIAANAVTILCVLFACSHGGMVDEGLYYFQSMRNKYGVLPEMEHYACVVDLLGRVGRLDEAVEFINDMPMEPSAMIWQTLLGACRVHGKVDLGKIAAEKILSVKPETSATYVLLSNTYIATGSLKEGLSLRDVMKERGVKKEPGNSWIVVRGRVHKFFSRDKQHPRKREIYAKLNELRLKVKTVGYVPDLTFAMQELE